MIERVHPLLNGDGDADDAPPPADGARDVVWPARSTTLQGVDVARLTAIAARERVLVVVRA